jgi:phytoene dehydrogenase-like protein
MNNNNNNNNNDNDNNVVYDLVIVGAGPSGLALAQCCSKSGKKILLIDKAESIGGCHRSGRRSYDNLFIEYHGPRVYSSTYKVFQHLLNEMNVDFYNLFVKSHFSITEIGGQTIFSVL